MFVKVRVRLRRDRVTLSAQSSGDRRMVTRRAVAAWFARLWLITVTGSFPGTRDSCTIPMLSTMQQTQPLLQQIRNK